jgi:hypothetical protein
LADEPAKAPALTPRALHQALEERAAAQEHRERAAGDGVGAHPGVQALQQGAALPRREHRRAGRVRHHALEERALLGVDLGDLVEEVPVAREHAGVRVGAALELVHLAQRGLGGAEHPVADVALGEQQAAARAGS